MRIIAGEFKSRRLNAPRGQETRPTSDRAREALFSHLEAAQLPPSGWNGLRVLDLYAGSGALGLEALSRGAAHTTFVEQSTTALRCLRANIDLLRAPARTRLLRGRIPQCLATLEGGFHLVLLDPPYEDPQIPGLGTRLALLADRTAPCVTVFEHRRRSPSPDLSPWLLDHTLHSGEAAFSIFHLSPD